jgi:hypothetical protein
LHTTRGFVYFLTAWTEPYSKQWKFRRQPLMKFSSRSDSRRGGGGLRAASLASYAVGCFRCFDEKEIDRERNGTSLPIILQGGQLKSTARNTVGSVNADPRTRSQGPAPVAIETSADQPIITAVRPFVAHRASIHGTTQCFQEQGK